MRAILILSLALSTLLMQSCGTEQVYEGLRNRQRIECQKLPKSELEECLKRVDVNYEEYRQKRDEVQESE